MLDRREFLGATGLTAAWLALGRTSGATAASSAASSAVTVYLGSFGSPGLRTGTVDDAGTLTVTGTVAGVPDASFLAVHGGVLYTTNERATGTVTSIDRATMTVLNTQPTRGAGPTHLSVHPSGSHLLTANYSDGTVVVHPIAADGTIGESTDLVQHQGADRDPHAHQVVTDPSGRWVLAVDLGADSVYVYALDGGRLARHHRLRLPVGAGPRHLTFHPGGGVAYILCELRPEITVAAWDAEAGMLTAGQVIPTAPAGNHPAEIAISGDGRFVYASNRGEDTVAAFAVRDDALAFLASTPTGGAWPRHFALSPDERRIHVANQNSGTVTCLPRDRDTGLLGPARGSTGVPSVSVVSFPAP